MICDECGKPLKNWKNDAVAERPELTSEGKYQWVLEVIIGRESTFNKGNLCKDCLLKLVKNAKLSRR